MQVHSSTPDRRLVEVDALRGVAAMAVVGYHFTTRYLELYGTGATPSVSLPHGHFGVNLFFIISGFVIFMTLARTRQPMDFVVSRLSRLFPAYWVAVALTFAVTTIWGLAGKEVTPLQALANLTMIHGLAGVPHVDGVYWTLEVELLFYAGMLALFMTRSLHRVHVALVVLIGLKLVYHVAATYGVTLSWTVSRLLILNFIPWFALGICVYQAVTATGGSRAGSWVTALAALGCLGIADGWVLAVIALMLACLVWGAAAGKLPWLGHPVLAYFGTISYTLYLLHENIGWVVIRESLARGLSFDASIAVALAVTVSLASLVTFTVERPAMNWIRQAYRSRRPQPTAS
jgi:peptidoglycan/LPS O-acetylase OafA/YrhL